MWSRMPLIQYKCRTGASGPSNDLSTLFFFHISACIDTHPDCKYLKDRCSERAPVRRLCPITCGVKCSKFSNANHLL